jgi:hypothetical protein
MNRSLLGLSDPQDPVLIFCRFDDGLSARSSLAVNDPWDLRPEEAACSLM